jgi:predicted RNase H-like HicB family nuclease
MKITRFALTSFGMIYCPDSDGTFTVISTFSPSRRGPGPIPAMGTGRSLSSGRASRGPVGRCGEVFGVNIDPLSFDEPRVSYQHYRYRITLRPLSAADGGGWLAEVPELPGCMSDGDTPQEAVDNVMDAIACWIEAAEEDGRPVPQPAGADAA